MASSDAAVKATFLVPYPVGWAPGQRFRFEQWLGLLPPGAVDAQVLPLLTPSGYERLYEQGGWARKATQISAGLARRTLDAIRARPDVVVVYREAFPLGPPLFETILARRAPVVFDVDDATFLGHTSEANAAIARLKMPHKVGRIIEAATATTVANEYLASYARRFSANVHVIPTTIDVERYRPRRRRPGPLLRVGWSGSPTTSVHLYQIEAALRRMVEELPVELVVIGDTRFRLPGVARVEARRWRRETEIGEVGSFDIGLMPLPDDEWSRGKAGFKALLYMALGVATVASPVGVNTDIVVDGQNGLLASTSDEWVDAVARLVGDERFRRQLAEAGRRTVVERYAGQLWAPRFLAVLEEAAASRSAP